VIEYPTIEILPPLSFDPLDKAIERIKSYQWIVFTSINGVSQFLDRFRHLGRDIGDLKKSRIVTIGPETAKGLEPYGFRAYLVPKKFRAEGILEDLDPDEVRGNRFLLPRVAGARDVLPKTLGDWGALVDVVEAYRVVPVNGDSARLRSLFLDRKIDMVTFTSSSTITHFAEQLGGETAGELLKGVAVACIGPIAKKTAEERGFRVDVVPAEYTIEGLTRSIVDYFSSGEQRAKG
jgi:uroporphyrinogen III methyltransferase/synthase